MRYLGQFIFVVLFVALARVGYDLINAGALRRRQAAGHERAKVQPYINPQTGKPASGPVNA